MKLEVYIPEDLSEITLEQYQRFEKLNTKDNANTNFLLQKMVEIFCRIDLKDVANIKFSQVQDIAQHLDNVFSQKSELKKTFTLDGIKYGFIPKLDDISFGEYIDLDNYLGKWDEMHKAMSVLYRPITVGYSNKYGIEPYNGRINEAMRKAPLDVVMGAMFFFYSLSNELLRFTQSYLQRVLMSKEISQQVQDLEKNGGGISQSMRLLKETLGDLTKSLPRDYISA